VLQERITERWQTFGRQFVHVASTLFVQRLRGKESTVFRAVVAVVVVNVGQQAIADHPSEGRALKGRQVAIGRLALLKPIVRGGGGGRGSVDAIEREADAS
jgi:hypothetical protein